MRLLAVVVGVDDAGRAVRVTDVASQPLGLSAPIDVLIRLPDVLATAAETKCFESHAFKSDVASQDHQIGPRNLATILLFDRPEQVTRLVQTDIIRPTVERREALLTSSCAAAAVPGAVCASAVPRHANEQRTVVSEVGRPPIL